MKLTGILSKSDYRVIFVLFLFILASIEPPISLPFAFPQTTWGVMKLGLLLVFLYTLLKIWAGEKDYFHKRKAIFLAPLFFLVANVLSFFPAANLSLSWSMLLYLLIGLSFYFLAIYYLQKPGDLKLFMKVILGFSLLSGVFSLVMLTFFHYEGLEFIGNFLVRIFPREGAWRFIGDFQRRRLQTFWLVEYSIPILLYFIFYSKKLYRWAILGFILSFISIMLANNRFQFVSLALGVVLFFWFNRQLILQHKKKVTVFLASLVVVMLFSVLVSNLFLGRNLIERFMLTDYQRDVETITGRFYLFDQAWKMFLSSPVVGIGLRNFSFYLSPQAVIYSSPLWQLHEINFYPHYEPHNIFFQLVAETGIIGLAAYLILIFSFIWQDIFLYQKTKSKALKTILMTISLSSWLYFVDEQFTYINDALMAQVFFWFSRGLLAGFYFRTKRKREKPISDRKLMLVVNQWDRFGGVEKEVNHLSLKLRKDFQVSVFVLPQRRRWHPITFIFLWWQILRERPAVVISFGEYVNLVSGLTGLFTFYPVKLIFAEYNNPTAMFAPQHFKWIKKGLIWFFYHHAAAKVVAVSQAAKQDLVKNFGIDKKKIVVISTSVQINKVEAMAKKKVSFPKGVKKRDYLIAVGRLSKEKRFAYLLNVFQELIEENKQFQLLILGEGKERNYLTKKIKQLHLKDKVFLLGGKDNPFPYIKKAKALILTSAAEGIPRVILEAMACDTLAISTNFPGVRKIITDYENGLVVGIKNKRELKAAIKEAYNNHRLRRKMVLAAKKKVKKYDSTDVIHSYQKLLNNL